MSIAEKMKCPPHAHTARRCPRSPRSHGGGRLLAGLLSALSVFASTTTLAATMDKVVVSYLPVVHGLPLFIAIEEKMFEKAGLAVEATRFENPNQIIDSLVSGRADSAPAGGAAGITALAESRFPGVLRVFALQGSNTPMGMMNDALIVKLNSPIKSFADLKGKKLAHTPGIQWRTVARTIVKANKLDPDKEVELVELAIGLHAQAVASGTIDGALTLEPIGSIVAAKGEVAVATRNPAGRFIVEPFYAGAGIVSAKFLKERPQVARRFIEVMDQATTLAQKNFNGYRKHLINYTAVTPDTMNVVAPMYFRGSGDLGPADIAAYQKFADIFAADGAMPAKIDVNKLILRRAEIK